jgi:hypothetical protein
MSKVIHYYPDALVVFVKSFKGIETLTQNDLLLASGQAKEITSIQVTMTVGSSPSTFSITLNDVANRFSVRDHPDEEVANLRSNSEFQIQRDRDQRNLKPITDGGLSYYEFDGFKDCKYPWLTFEHGVLVDDATGDRCVMNYRRRADGSIAERWAFDAVGRIIRFSDKYSEAFFNDPTNNGVYVGGLPVRDIDGKVTSHNYIFYKYKNSDFLGKYQTGVNDSLKVGRCKIEPMDRVAVFLSERFQETENGDYKVVQTPKANLVRGFTGLVNTVQMAYADSGNTITVNGEDVTKWMKISVVPVNPSALPKDDQAGGALRFSATDDSQFNIYTNIFQSIRTPDVIRLLTLGTEGLDRSARARLHAFKNVKFRGIGFYSAARTKNKNNENIVYDAKKDRFVVVRNKQQVATVSVIDFTGMLGTLFTKSAVHVIDPTETKLATYLAYNKNFQLPQTLQSEFQTRRDICYKAATDSNFNFYADRNGHIWFHPPRYSNAWILTQQNDKLYIIDDDSIISYGFVEEDTNVYSTCIVSSEPDLNKNVTPGTENFNRGSYTDEMIMHKFGTKIITMSNPFIASIKQGPTSFSTANAIFYAKAMLQRLLANKMQGQITLTGRAELDPGYPVYIPFRNMIYWVETVEHSLQFGGRYETTIHLSYGHKPWESIAEVITQSFDMIHSTDGHIRIEREKSTGQPQTNNRGVRRHRAVKTVALPPDKKTTPVLWLNTQKPVPPS